MYQIEVGLQQMIKYDMLLQRITILRIASALPRPTHRL